MGYFFVGAKGDYNRSFFHAILGGGGYSVVRPDAWAKYVAESENVVDFSIISGGGGAQYPDAFKAVFEVPVTTVYRNGYPLDYVGSVTAKLKWPSNFNAEECQYRFISSRIQGRDVAFKFSDLTGISIDDNYVRMLLGCFLAGPRKITFEVCDDILRICEKPSVFGKIMGANKTGDTISAVADAPPHSGGA